MSYLSVTDAVSVSSSVYRPAMDTKTPKITTAHLEEIYFNAVRPFEELYDLQAYSHKPPMTGHFFGSSPVVLVLGPKNSGKTSFIRQMLGQNFPGMEISAESSPNVFSVIQNGEKDQLIPGDLVTLAEDPSLRGLAKLGNSFTDHYVKIKSTADILETVWFVDSPRLDQDFSEAQIKGLKWFAKIAWKIIILFDTTKLRYGKQTKLNLQLLIKYYDKFHFLMNKAHMVKPNSILHQQNRLLNSIHNTWHHDEIDYEPIILISSFIGDPEDLEEDHPLYIQFKQDSDKIYSFLSKSSKIGCELKINQIEKRAKLTLYHAELLLILREKIPKINKMRGKPDWIQHAKQLLKKAVKEVKQSEKMFEDVNFKEEFFLTALQEEKFKFSRDKKKLEKLEVLLTDGFSLLRKQLFGNMTTPEVEVKLSKAGLIRLTRARRKSNTKDIKKHDKDKDISARRRGGSIFSITSKKGKRRGKITRKRNTNTTQKISTAFVSGTGPRKKHH